MTDTILAKKVDEWGSMNYGLPCGLYFYFMNDTLPGWQQGTSDSVIGNCSAIQSVQFTPFIEPWDLVMYHVDYDTERFGSVSDTTRNGLSETPLVFRITGIDNSIKKIGSFKCYSPKKTIGGEKNWRNESRLYNYPYSFAMLTDNLNPPMEIKYHLCEFNVNDVMVRNTISDRCSYGIYVNKYKGDFAGKLESLVSGDAHELPCSSSAYSQWYASNKNQVAQNVRNNSEMAFIQNASLQKQNVANMIGQATNLSLNPLSAIGVGASMYSSNLQNKTQQQMNKQNVQNSIAMAMAQANDMKSTPNTMISMGSDVYYGLDKGEKKVNLYRFGLTEEFYNKLGDYFAMFGYKQNRIMIPGLRNRYYYNYVKTIGANVTSNTMPRNYLEELKSIYDNGVTIWHVGRDGVIVGDYSKDNYEY